MDLLRRLTAKDEDSIPLLQNEESQLFTDEEVAQGRRRRLLLRIAKMLAVVGAVVLLFGIFKTVFYLYHRAPGTDTNMDYRLDSIRVSDPTDVGLSLSLSAAFNAKTMWSVNLRDLKMQVMDAKSGVPLIVADMPDMSVKSHTWTDVALQKVQLRIGDAKALSAAINEGVTARRIDLRIVVRTTIRPHWVPLSIRNVRMEKLLSLDLDALLGSDPTPGHSFALENIAMEETADDSLVVTGDGRFTNPLPFAMDLVPQLAFVVYSEGVRIGQMRSVGSFSLRHGKGNRVRLAAHLEPQTSPATSRAVGRLVSNYLAGRTSRVLVRGDAEGSAKLKWVQAIIAGVDVWVNVPGGTSDGMFEDAIKNVDVKMIRFALDPALPDRISLDSDAEVAFGLPRGLSMLRVAVERVGLEGQVADERGNFIAPLLVPDHPVQMLKGKTAFATSLAMDISVQDENLSTVQALLTDLLHRDEAHINISGQSSMRTRMILGRVSVPRVAFATQITLPGMRRVLGDNVPDIGAFVVDHATRDELQLSASVRLMNESPVSGHMGPIHFQLMSVGNADDADKDNIFGEVLLPDARLEHGENRLQCRVRLDASAATGALIGRYVSGDETTVRLQGVEESAMVHPILKSVMGSLIMNARVENRPPHSFISAITLKRRPFSLFPEAFTTVTNPFSVAIRILHLRDLRVYGRTTDGTGEEVLITEMEAVTLKEPIEIPPNVEEWTSEEPMPVQLDADIARIMRVLRLLLGNDTRDEHNRPYVSVRIETRLLVAINAFQIEFFFKKDHVRLYYGDAVFM